MNTVFYEMVARGNWVVLDTETTGLDRGSEICQIALLDSNGKILNDLLVKPRWFIPRAASAIHGITDEMVIDAPTWPQIRPAILTAIEGRDVITYNAKFDRKLMHWSDEQWGLEHHDYHMNATWHCAMEMYAEHYGVRNDYYGSFAWQKLEDACRQQDIAANRFHSAMGDALATWMLVCKLYLARRDSESR